MEHVNFTSLSPTNEHQQVQQWWARFVRALPGTAKTSDDAADDVNACSCHKNASISC
jgi:hypothetical protein